MIAISRVLAFPAGLVVILVPVAGCGAGPVLADTKPGEVVQCWGNGIVTMEAE